MRLTLNQLDMAIAALRVVRRFARPADSVLRHFFRDNSKLGVNDRAFITETVFGVLRHFFPLSISSAPLHHVRCFSRTL